MKHLFSKHYRKVFEREPVALTEVLEIVKGREEFTRMLTGETQEGDEERFLLETYLAFSRVYGPIRTERILKQFLKTFELMWR